MRRKITQVARDLAALLDSGLVRVHLDATDKDVDVPANFKTNKHLILNLSRRFAHADLALERTFVRATLTFGAAAYCCTIPYRDIFCLESTVSGEVTLYPENMPEEFLQQVQAAAAREENKLRVVPSGAASDNKADKNNNQPTSKSRKKCVRPKLQVIDGGAD